MPSPIIPRKSGLHRAACFALFRALFRQINRLELVQPQKSALQTRLRKGIRANLNEQSIPAVSTALRRGYALLKVLHEGVDKPLSSQFHIFDFATIPIQRTSSPSLPDAKPLPLPPPTPPPTEPPPSKVTKRPNRGPPVWPQHPNAPSIFDRPFSRVSGRRRVPFLVVSSGFPFLRIKKPQPPYLGRIIRDDIRLFHKRFERMHKLTDHCQVGFDEQSWDKTLESTCGLPRDYDGGTWYALAEEARRDANDAITNHRQKRMDMARKMQGIVDKEQALADQERLQRRNEKHQERKKRRLERRAASNAEASNEEASNEEDTVDDKNI